MKLDIRRLLSFCDHREVEAGHRHALPLRRVASVAMVGNPYAGRYVEDLSEAIEASAEVGRVLSKLAVELMGPYDIESYGKGGVVGLNGELERQCHADDRLCRTAARSGRGCRGLDSFLHQARGAGQCVDVPLAHKDALYVRSHYDGVSITLPSDAPAADEVALIVCLANRGRLNARVGGLAAKDIVGKDGLR